MAKKNLYKKVTFTLPESVVNDLNREVQEGQRSEFVYQSIKDRLTEKKFYKLNKGEKFTRDLYNFTKILPKFNFSELDESKQEGRE